MSSSDAVAEYIQRLTTFDQVKDINANVFTENREVIEAVINDNNVDGELLSKNDFVTMENELVNDEGMRISSTHTTTIAVQNSTVTYPHFEPDTGELKNAMVVQGNVPVSLYLSQTSAGLDADIQAALDKQLRFGLDSAAGVMKNCIAAHNIIHSLLLSALMFFRSKIVENGSSLADNEEGKIMAICRIANTLIEISSLLQEAKKVSYKLVDESETKNEEEGDASSVAVGEKYLTKTKLPAKCNFCNVAGHGPTPVVGQFSDKLRKEYLTRNEDIIKKKRNAVQKGGLNDIFITRSSGASLKAASVAIQYNYAVNNGERSSIECAFKRAKFDSQIGQLIQNNMDSRIQEAPEEVVEHTDEIAGSNAVAESSETNPSPEQVATNENEEQSDMTLNEISGVDLEEFVKRVFPQFTDEENNIMSEEEMMKTLIEVPNNADQVAAGEEKESNVEKVSQPLVKKLKLQRIQDQLTPPQLELTRPLPFISPLRSPAPPPPTGPSYGEMVNPLPLSVGSVLEPSQAETDRVASEIRTLEMMGQSPSLPAIRGRDRQNRASMKKFVKKSRSIFDTDSEADESSQF